MKLNKHVLYAVLITGLVLFFTGISLVFITGLIKVEERKPVNPYDALKRYIKQASITALKLNDFTWDEFFTIGLEAPPSEICRLGERVTEKGAFKESKGFKWIPLPEMLPRPESARPFVLYCDMCLKMVEGVKPDMSSDGSTTPQWLALCSQLQSTLNGAQYLATNYKNTNTYVLNNISNSINNSDSKLKQKYLEKFKNKSTKYLSLLEDLVNNLQLAEQALLQLTDGKLPSQTITEESTDQ